MKKDSKIIGWQISLTELNLLNEIIKNYNYRTLSQVLYDLMYKNIDVNALYEDSKVFAEKQRKNNLKKV